MPTARLLDHNGTPIAATLDETDIVVEVDYGGEQPAGQPTATVRAYDGDTVEVPLQPVEGAPGIYRSEPFDPSGELEFGDSHVFTAEVDGASAAARIFETPIDAARWQVREDIERAIRDAERAGANLTYARHQLLKDHPESEERDLLQEALDAKIDAAKWRKWNLERALETLDSDELYPEQQWAIARAEFAQITEGVEIDIPAMKSRLLEDIKGSIADAYTEITIGGYEMLGEFTGAQQMITLSLGIDARGNEVGWGQRALAFVDLLANGVLAGVGIRQDLDRLMAASKPRTAIDASHATPRYAGVKPEVNAPSGSVVDPRDLGMPESSIRAFSDHARRNNHVVLVRPTNPEAIPLLDAGALPKPELLKSKTVNELDALLGMDAGHRAKVALFDPEVDYFRSAMREAGLGEDAIEAQITALRNGDAVAPPPGFAAPAMWDQAVGRFHLRHAEFHGAIGKDTMKHVEAGLLRIEQGVVIDAATGKPFTGDHDLFEFLTTQGVPLSHAKYLAAVDELKAATYVEHGAHHRWNPQRSDFPEGAFGDAKYEAARNIYESIIKKHQAEEILIAFTPEGIPIAVFANERVRPVGFRPSTAGSLVSIPTRVRVVWTSERVAEAIEQNVVYDEDSQAWLEADADFRAASDHAPSELAEEPAAPSTAQPATAGRSGPRTPVLVGAVAAIAVLLVLLGLAFLGGGDGDETATADESNAAAPADGTVEVAVGAATTEVSGSSDLTAGEEATIVVTVRDSDGTPVSGVPWFITIGDPPSSAEAVHAEARTDDDGVARFRITPGTAGPNVLWTSDGSAVARVAAVDIN